MDPPFVALVGAPNTGKSTLFNRLLGRRKALVHLEPGMTRDVNEAPCNLGGRAVRLLDTGGLLGPDESLLAGDVRRRVLEAVREAAALVFLVDGRRGLLPRDRDLAQVFRATGHPVLLAVNKIDVPSRTDAVAEFWELGFPQTFAISAEHGVGIDDLIVAVLAHLPAEEAAASEDARGETSLAIAGRPNVGKSSLLNALLGQERVIVSDQPGTTRDAIDTLFKVSERVYRIIDTAGLRRRGHVAPGPEALSAMAARRSIERADVVLIVMDCTEAPTMQDLHVAGVAIEAGRPFIVVLNKWDLRPATGSEDDLVATVKGRLRFAPWAPILTTSVPTGRSIARILPLVDAVHAEATRRLSTGRLNRWLNSAVAAHAPSTSKGKEFRLQYAAQTGTNPPAILIFTNQKSPPHFSYRRYLENSLRSAFDLGMTPVILKFRRKPRASGASGPSGRRRRRSAV